MEIGLRRTSRPRQSLTFRLQWEMRVEDIGKRIRLAKRAEAASLAYLILSAFIFPLTLEGEAEKVLFMTLAAISAWVGVIGLLVPWQLRGSSAGLLTPTEGTHRVELTRSLEREVHRLRSRIWETEGRHSPLLKDTEFAYKDKA